MKGKTQRFALSKLHRKFDLGRYSLFMAGGAFVFWLILLGIGTYNSMGHGSAQILHASAGSLSLTIAWLIFVAGFASALSAALKSNRGIHIGFLVPSENENTWIEKFRPRLKTGTWSDVFCSSLLFSVAGAGISFAIFGFLGTHMVTVVLVSVLFPSGSAAIASWWNSRHSVRVLIYSQKHNLIKDTSVFRYILFQNALPYTLFFSLLGIAIAFWRFSSKQMNGNLVPVDILCRHLSATSFFITFFLTSAARVKAKIDFLGPLEFRDAPKTKMLRVRWRLWYSLLVPPVVYFLGKLIFFISSIEHVQTTTAVITKGFFCFVFGLAFCTWAVRTNLGEMIVDGRDQHPYIRFRNFLQRAQLVESNSRGK